MSDPMQVTITHEITESSVRTTVTLPGKRPISKMWVCCDGGMLGKFKKDWDEDPRLNGWHRIAEAAQATPDPLD